MTAPGTRTVGCGPFRVELKAHPAKYLRVLEAAAGAAPPPARATTLRLHLRVHADGTGTLRHPSGRERIPEPWLAGATAQGHLLAALESWGHSALMLHSAALVAPAGGTLLLPAASGTGKSTGALALAARGWRCLSDDLAFWFPERGFVAGPDMGIALKQPAPAALMPRLQAWRHLTLRFRDPGGRFATRHTYQQPPTGLPWRAPVRAVGFLTRGPGRPRIRTLTAGEALARLWPMRVAPVTVETRKPAPALSRVAGLLNGMQLAEIRTGRVGDVAGAIERWLGAQGPRG